MYCFNFEFNKKFILILGLFIVLCLSMSLVNATDITNNSVDSSSINFDNDNQNTIRTHDSLIQSYNVSSEDDFKEAFNHLKSSSGLKYGIINIVNDIKVKNSNILSIVSNDTTFEINGNGHTIKVSNPNERAENHFLTCGNKSNVIINNLTLSGFNTAIINQGILNLKDVTFEGNRLNYWICEDYGGAIKSNGGLLSCTDCTFINNYAKKGGAIYLGRNAEANIKDCHFEEKQLLFLW